MADKALVMRGIGISKDSKVFPRPLQVIFKDEIKKVANTSGEMMAARAKRKLRAAARRSKTDLKMAQSIHQILSLSYL